MLTDVKKYADSHDIKGLRYIFADCLDVDPTFEKYRSDYEYCKTIEGMFEKHQELTELTDDQGKWTRQYWEQLKLDLMKNFSRQRFEHMVKAAKVVYADKIERLYNERRANQQIIEKEAVKPNTVTRQSSVKTSTSEAELQEKKLVEKQREIEAHNMKIEAEQREQRARIDAARREEGNRQNNQNGNEQSKKALGIVLAIAIIVAVVLIIIVLH